MTIRSASSCVPDASASPVSVSDSMWSVTTDDATPADRVEEIAVGDQAHALVPRVVARVEVRVDVEAGGELPRELRADQPPHRGGPAAAEAVDRQRRQHVLPAHDRIRDPAGQHALQQAGDRVDRRQREDVTGRALEHRDVGGAPGERRDHRHGRRAAADDDDALAVVVDVVGPELRVHDLPAEALDARELRRVALVVAVVAGARVQEAAGQPDRLAGALDLDRPARVGRGPRGRHHAVTEPDVPVDPVLARRVADVIQDRRAVDDRARPGPRAERVAEREHVGVGAGAGEAEEVPRPADRLARLEDGERLARAALL